MGEDQPNDAGMDRSNEAGGEDANGAGEDHSNGGGGNGRTATQHTFRACTRRRALALLGSGVVAGAAGVTGVATADSHDAEVYLDGGTWVAANGGSTVYSGGDLIDAAQAAVDSLTAGRTSKERVVVRDGGSVGPHEWDGDVHAIDLPSYTALDVQGTISVEDTGDDLIVPVRAQSVESIEVTNISVQGNPRYGVWIQSCNDVRLGNVDMALWETQDVGLGVRIDDSDGGRTTNVQLDYAYVEGSQHHAVETYGVDGFDVGTVETQDTGGCGLLLNDTTDASVGTVDAVNPDAGGGYAGFRVANGAGPNVHVDEVIVRGGARGVFGVSGSHGFTVEHVDIEGTEVHGILLQDCQNASINGGTVRNTDNEAVRIDSRSEDTHQPSSEITVQNLRVVDDRASPQQTYGVYETGPDTGNNYILNNDLRNAGTVADLEVYASSTVTEGNVLTGQQPPDDTGTDLAQVDGVVPQDLNGDGLHRDLNANDRVDSDDVVTYFDHMDDPAITDNVDAYDYNANGRIDFDDIVTLFDSM